MPNASKLNLIFLLEGEVRIAARALKELKKIDRDDPEQQDALGEAMVTALNACMVALNGAENDDATLLLTNPDALGLKPNVEVKAAPVGVAP